MFLAGADRRLQIRNVSVGLTTLATASGALAAGAAAFEDTKTLSIWLVVTGAVLTLLSGAAWLVWLCWPTPEEIARFSLRLMRDNEIDAIRRFVERHLGSDLISVDEMRSMCRCNAELVWVVESKDDAGQPQIVGCISIFPLKKGGVDLLEKGDYAAAIKASFIAKKRGTPKGIYIGAVVGSSRPVKAFVLNHVRSKVSTMCTKHGVAKLFGRPITEDGIRLLKKENFMCVIGGGPPRLNFVCVRTWSAS
jgi:hypothetical protein